MPARSSPPTDRHRTGAFLHRPIATAQGRDTTMSNTTEQRVRELGSRWAEAEKRGDIDALDALSTDDFTLVGPLGFVLNKQQWLDRYRTGALVTQSLVWDDIEVREYGHSAVAIGSHSQRAEYQGNSADGRFRATHLAIRRGDDWLLAGMHLSPLGGPPPFTA
jgi:ketosteroid isomerase-like protein